MGQQQLLLIILGVIIVGIAIAVGLSLFSAQSVQSNKDAMVNDINNIAANAYQFRIRPTSMGGGGNAYTGNGNTYTIPSKMSSDENATYSATVTDANNIKFTATSSQNSSNYFTVSIGSDGRATAGTWSFNGDFQ
jgi:hypothetical protein